MKIFSTIVFFIISSCIYSQDFTSGALRTDPAVYDRIGKAPLPMGSEIPISVDLSSRMPPVGNQYPQNSCVAWTVAYANYSYLNKSSVSCDFYQNNEVNLDCLFSPSFVYNQINDGQNKGTRFEHAFNIMTSQGVAPLSAMPYLPNDWWTQPNANARQNASNHKISSYWQLGQNGEDFFTATRAWLAEGFPVIASVKVDNYLKRTANFATPYVWNNWSGQIETMGHAILIVGYDDNTRTFKFINSYGSTWGNNGYGYISYAMYKDVLNEAFIIKTQGQNQLSQNVLASEEKAISPIDVNAGLFFNVGSVEHFQFQPGQFPPPAVVFSKTMTFRGQVSIPNGVGNTAQVLVYFFLNNQGQKGPQVGSINPLTQTLSGQAVTGTPVVNLSQSVPFNSNFFAVIKYSDLNIPKGYPGPIIQTDLIAEPVLLVDGFPVRIGAPHFFFVRI